VTDVDAAIAAAFHEEWGRVVATLIRTTGDWDLAEDCAQDAFAQAVRSWPRDGIPGRPGAWLTTVARNRALDRLRRGSTETAKLRQVATLAGQGGGTAGPPPGDGDDGGEFPDDRLRLIFTCCHPALPLDARVALTLRTLAGLTTAEIARAFLVPEPTMAKRLVRAKHKIRNAGIPYQVPPPHLLPQRTTGVLAVLYLLFNEGYAASSGQNLIRESLCQEAIRLARALAQLMPGECEAGSLLALMLLQHSRRLARVDAAGDLVTLEDQDRTRWDRAEIDEAIAVLQAIPPGPAQPGPYQVQAAIASCHGTAASPADTDWATIARLYTLLAGLLPSPVVELNRAVAVAMADGPAAGLPLLDALDQAGLAGYYLLPATRADLLRRLGQRDGAAASYREALALAPSEAERRYLTRRLAEVTR
jgi:RNA polymerase sigma-70 factor (ECF subfamily)